LTSSRYSESSHRNLRLPPTSSRSPSRSPPPVRPRSPSSRFPLAVRLGLTRRLALRLHHILFASLPALPARTIHSAPVAPSSPDSTPEMVAVPSGHLTYLEPPRPSQLVYREGARSLPPVFSFLLFLLLFSSSSHFASSSEVAKLIPVSTECTQCFDTQDGPQGIDVCLSCFNGACPPALASSSSPSQAGDDAKSGSANGHGRNHYERTGHRVVVNIRRRRKPQAEMKRNKRVR
jgi:hypothetical protein